MSTTRLPRAFYTRDARLVARDLLGQILVTELNGIRTAGRIIETEAYLGIDDLASHSHRGETARNRSMFLTGGHAYVYLIYGMYFCFNVVTGQSGDGEAVLIRGIEPLDGIERMRERRGGASRADRNLANGPGKLAIALAIGPALDGADLVENLHVWIEPREPIPAGDILVTPRIGITKSADLPWRWTVKNAKDKRA